MKRYAISPVTGNGTFQNPYRAAVSDITLTNTNSLIPTHPIGHQDAGKPKYLHAPCIVATQNLPGVLQVSNLFALPDYVLDGRMDGMESAIRAAMVQSIEAYSFDPTPKKLDATNSDSESYREFLNRLFQQLDAAFNVNNFDAQEPQS